MDNISDLFKKEHTGQLILLVLFVVYLVMGYNTPEPIAGLVDTLVGKIVIFIVVIYLFLHSNPLLAVISLFVAFDLIRRSSATTGISALQKYAPSEQKKMSQFNAYNQFPYTLEQEVVKKMAPVVQSGSSLSQASYKPLLDNIHDASPLSGLN
jgi:hypothetical protein